MRLNQLFIKTALPISFKHDHDLLVWYIGQLSLSPNKMANKITIEKFKKWVKDNPELAKKAERLRKRTLNKKIKPVEV